MSFGWLLLGLLLHCFRATAAHVNDWSRFACAHLMWVNKHTAPCNPGTPVEGPSYATHCLHVLTASSPARKQPPEARVTTCPCPSRRSGLHPAVTPRKPLKLDAPAGYKLEAGKAERLPDAFDTGHTGLFAKGHYCFYSRCCLG